MAIINSLIWTTTCMIIAFVGPFCSGFMLQDFSTTEITVLGSGALELIYRKQEISCSVFAQWLIMLNLCSIQAQYAQFMLSKILCCSIVNNAQFMFNFMLNMLKSYPASCSICCSIVDDAQFMLSMLILVVS